MNLNIYVWIFMIFIALIQRSGNIQCFVFEVCIYLIISKYFKGFKRNRSDLSDSKKYKYEKLDSDNKSVDISSDEFDWDQVDDYVNEARLDNELRNNRILSYDFREFEGRKNVDWNEVYQYLWNQCRYKGILMWREYMDELVKKGVMKKDEIKLVFKKAGNYIPWNPRPDLEAVLDYEKENERKAKKQRDSFFDEMNNYAESLYKKGVWNKDDVKKYMKSTDSELSYLKMFDYEEYLKRKGIL